MIGAWSFWGTFRAAPAETVGPGGPRAQGGGAGLLLCVLAGFRLLILLLKVVLEPLYLGICLFLISFPPGFVLYI